MLYGFCRMYRTANTEAKKQDKKKDILLGQENETYGENLYTVNETGLTTYKTKHRQIGKKQDYKIYKKTILIYRRM